jgi:response regulator NasT
MERQQLSENDIYGRLRKATMNTNLRLIEVAQRMLDVADLLG